MRKIRALAGACAAVLAGASFQQPDQQPEIRVEVEAVNVLVTVTDRKGRFVTGLPRRRFRVVENGVQQPITHFSHQADLPLKIALLMDTSSSVRLNLDFQKKAAIDFLHVVMRLQDQALLVEFDTGLTLLHDFTNRPGILAREIETLRAGGGTALFDALYTVAGEKLNEGESRKAIVVLSDGMDLHSKRSLEEALRMLQSTGAIVYAIGTTRFAADVAEAGEKMLNKLAEESGGLAFFPYSSGQLAQAFEQINRELRSQYSLTYVPINKARDGRFRKIEVRVLQDKGLTIRHRRGYYAPGRPIER